MHNNVLRCRNLLESAWYGNTRSRYDGDGWAVAAGASTVLEGIRRCQATRLLHYHNLLNQRVSRVHMLVPLPLPTHLALLAYTRSVSDRCVLRCGVPRGGHPSRDTERPYGAPGGAATQSCARGCLPPMLLLPCPGRRVYMLRSGGPLSVWQRVGQEPWRCLCAHVLYGRVLALIDPHHGQAKASLKMVC